MQLHFDKNFARITLYPLEMLQLCIPFQKKTERDVSMFNPMFIRPIASVWSLLKSRNQGGTQYDEVSETADRTPSANMYVHNTLANH